MRRFGFFFAGIAATVLGFIILNAWSGQSVFCGAKKASVVTEEAPFGGTCPIPLTWKPYLNRDFGFRMMIPETWEVRDDNGGIVFGDTLDHVTVYDAAGARIVHILRVRTKAETLDEWISENVKKKVGENYEVVNSGNSVDLARWILPLEGGAGTWQFSAFYGSGSVIQLLYSSVNQMGIGERAVAEHMMRTISRLAE